MVEQQQRPRGVGFQPTDLDLRLEMQHDAFVAETDPEVLKAPVPASGRRQPVVELIAEDGRSVTGRSPQRGFAASAVMVVIEHPPACDRVAQLHRSSGDGVPLDVELLTVDPSEMSGLEAVLLAHEHFDLGGEAQEVAVEVVRDPVPASVAGAVRRLRCVVPLMLAEQHDLRALGPSA